MNTVTKKQLVKTDVWSAGHHTEVGPGQLIRKRKARLELWRRGVGERCGERAGPKDDQTKTS